MDYPPPPLSVSALSLKLDFQLIDFKKSDLLHSLGLVNPLCVLHIQHISVWTRPFTRLSSPLWFLLIIQTARLKHLTPQLGNSRMYTKEVSLQSAVTLKGDLWHKLLTLTSSILLIVFIDDLGVAMVKDTTSVMCAQLILCCTVKHLLRGQIQCQAFFLPQLKMKQKENLQQVRDFTFKPQFHN